MNTHLSPQERARLLLRQMTLAEKVDLMTGNQGEAPYAFYNAAIPRLGRISESQGEDPFLNGDQNSVYAATLQSHNVIATLKHYTANNQETNGWLF
jgi:beta-glucosidase-like glycosyl hydrolase